MAGTAIALSGDYATPEMLKRDMGDLACSVDIFFDSNGWKRFQEAIERLESLVRSLEHPPIVIGYSRGGSAIARLSELVELQAAVLYESPIVDSDGVGGSFPVLQIWNDAGAKYSRFPARREQARHSEQAWAKNHPVTRLEGVGRHFTLRPPSHCWDIGLNQHISDWLASWTR